MITQPFLKLWNAEPPLLQHGFFRFNVAFQVLHFRAGGFLAIDSIAAADVPADPGHDIIPVVSGLWAVGRNPPFCNGELCVLQAVSGRTDRRNLCAHSEQSSESQDG